MADLTAKIRRI